MADETQTETTKETTAAETAEPKGPSSMADQIPEMSDSQLAALLANAEKISAAPKHAKKDMAAELIPLIGEELDKRAVIKQAEQAERRQQQAAKRAETRRIAKAQKEAEQAES